MALDATEVKAIMAEHQHAPNDTGSVEVQVALLTQNIKKLTEHFKIHKKDVHSRRGLLSMVNKRRSLLKYLSQKNYDRYLTLVKKLDIRH